MGGLDLESRGGMGERDVELAMASFQQPLPHNQNLNRPCSSASNSSGNCVRGASLAKMDDPVDEFPVGMRVLVVDDDPICLMVLERMLCRCSYRVTTCGRATEALSLLREDTNKFDLVISDVYMPDMDGFKLLELVGLEMDLPVIMMSGNGEYSAVMRGVTHGACDYLLKPVRIEELRNIWQHVVRKKGQKTRDVVHTKSLDEGGERQKRVGAEDADNTSSATDTTDGNCKSSKRRKEFKEEEEDNEQEMDDPTSMKRPRVVWSVELHQQFVSAVNQLGIDKAVPKRILELMGVHGLTRENVASHLQKYRLYLKRLSGGPGQQNNLNAHFSDPFSLISPQSMGVNLPGGPLAQLHMLGRVNPSSGVGFSNGFDPGLGQFLLQDLPKPPHLNGMLKSSSGLLPSLPNGLCLDRISDTHHLNLGNELDDFSVNSKVFPQLPGSNDLGMLGSANGNLVSNPSSEALLMHILNSRVAQPGGVSSANLQQPRSGLSPPQLLSNDISFSPVGSLSNLVGSLGPPASLSATSGSGGRELRLPMGNAGTTLSSPLGLLIQHAQANGGSLDLVNTAASPFSMEASIQSPKHGGSLDTSGNEGLNHQQSMWTPYNSVTRNGHMQCSSHDTLPTWSGISENLGLGDLGQSLSSGISSQFLFHGQSHGVRFAPPSRGSYARQNVNLPVSLALDSGMVRSSYEPQGC